MYKALNLNPSTTKITKNPLLVRKLRLGKKKKKDNPWHIPIISALGRLRQEACKKFQGSMGYIPRPCFKTTTTKKLTKDMEQKSLSQKGGL
jgi:hypothetical protein